MANNQNFENEDQELETRPAGNKDLWLFLIVLDVVFLCVFGFFIYQHFSGRFFESAQPAQKTDTPVVVEEIQGASSQETGSLPVVAVEEPEKSPVALPAEETSTAEVSVADLLKPQEKTESSALGKEHKQSILISQGKGKYRQVTFRWFGEGEKVAVVSGFTMSKPKELKKTGNFWETTLAIAPGSYKFLYVIDGKNMLDPYAPEKDGRSVLEVK